MDVDRKLEVEETPVTAKKGRGWPKGKKRGPRYPTETEKLSVDPPIEPPIHVRVARKGMEPFEFGCAQHFVEGGFHVFVYPSKRDPYRQTRREIAVSEIVDIEITQAAPVYSTQPTIHPTLASVVMTTHTDEPGPSVTLNRPVIHSAKENALRAMALKRSEAEREAAGLGITFGDSVG
jgi:hypothetical protein